MEYAGKKRTYADAFQSNSHHLDEYKIEDIVLNHLSEHVFKKKVVNITNNTVSNATVHFILQNIRKIVREEIQKAIQNVNNERRKKDPPSYIS